MQPLEIFDPIVVIPEELYFPWDPQITINHQYQLQVITGYKLVVTILPLSTGNHRLQTFSYNPSTVFQLKILMTVLVLYHQNSC